MNAINNLFTSLSLEKRALLEKQLLKKNIPARPQGMAAKNGKGPRPLSFGQESLWFFDQLESNSPLYNIPRAAHIHGPLNVEVLRRAFETIIARHEALRTNFILVDHEPRQIVAENKKFALPVCDLSALPELERQQEVQRLLDEEAKRPFDLTSDVMLRAALLRLGDHENILCVSLHHIAGDAWSLDLLNEELTTLYQSFCASKSSPLPNLDFQYSDFALYQRERFQGDVAARQIAYWKERLAGELPIMELLADRPRPHEQTFRGALRFFTFPAPLLAALKELSRRENVTAYSTLLAAFQVLLHRYSRLDDILVGTPVGTRNRSDTEKLIGYFINTVVLRSDLSGNPIFQELLRRIHRNVLGALTNQEVSLERLAEELKVPRHSGRNPIVQILFQYLATPMKQPEFNGVAAKMTPIDTHAAKFDLSLTMRDSAEGLHCEFEYNTDLFDAATIDRMAGHYRTLLETIVANPVGRIGNFPLLAQSETRQLLVEWNATKTSFPTSVSIATADPDCGCVGDQPQRVARQRRDSNQLHAATGAPSTQPRSVVPVSIPALLEKQAGATPDAIAVLFGKEQLTWRELNERANQLARYLKKLGVQPDMLIGICMERSIEMLVAVHGVLKAGAAYLPLDPEYPKERLLFMLEDAQVPVLLTQKHLVRNIPSATKKVICLDTEWKTIAHESAKVGRVTPCASSQLHESHEISILKSNNGALGVTRPTIHPDHLAYVIYTSGSTGQPKGVMISHGSICNHLFWMQKQFPLVATDRILQKTSFSFDVAVWELLAPVVTGASLVMAKPDGHRDSAYLAELIAEKEITMMQTVPSALRALLEEPEFTKCKSLKYVICGGEEMSADLMERFSSSSNAQLANCYGPTETCIDATVWVGTYENKKIAPPIGKPIANAEVYILDPHLQPVPIGVPGELCVGGRGLARGYLHRPELTAEKFIPHPFRKNPSARLYKTGDLARYRADGNIEFLGRIDHQVKVRGFRIELGEIESVLKTYPGISQTVVIARPDIKGDNRIIAYLVFGETPAPTDAELRACLKAKLPEYMMPSAFVFLEALPLNLNGKLDRNALPEPNYQPAQYIEPCAGIEQEMAQIWADVLGVKRVGVHDNFFELGGHSLLAAQIVSRMKRSGRTLALRDVFQSPTIVGLCRVLQTGTTSNSSAATPIKPIPRKRLQSAAQALVGFFESAATQLNAIYEHSYYLSAI